MKEEEIKNIFDLPKHLFTERELFETIFNTGTLRIERIISTGQSTPEGEWYDQQEDEWVVLLQGQSTIVYEDGRESHLKAGDYLLIPAHTKHRVEHTSVDPPCIWLAVHGELID